MASRCPHYHFYSVGLRDCALVTGDLFAHPATYPNTHLDTSLCYLWSVLCALLLDSSRCLITSKFMDDWVSTTNSAFRHYASSYSTEISNDKRRTCKRLFQVPFQYTRCINDVPLRVPHAPPNCPVCRHYLEYHHFRIGRYSS